MTPQPKRKKLSLKAEKKKAIKAFNAYIRERDKYTCFTCGKVGDKYTMDAGHLITAAREATRFDEMNTHCQCKGCNIKHEHDYEVYRKRFVEVYGERQYEEMYRRSFGHVGRKAQDYIAIQKEYKAKRKRIIGGDE